jgi:replication-associated recombination protein RarA
VIGQQKLKNTLLKLNTLPQFMIVSGPSGAGKSLFISELCLQRFNKEPIEISSIDDVRSICEAAVNIQEPTAYVLSTFDNVNFRTKEAILKLCEETPKHVYIFIETKSLSSIKQTLLSRAFLFSLEPYSLEELKRYCLTLENATETEISSLITVFNTPGNILRAKTCNIQQFITFCDKVVSFVCKATLSNTLKISNSLKLKADNDGYDLDLFFECVSKRALLAKDNLGIDSVYNIVKACSSASQQLYQIPTINKQMLFDSWLLNVRGVL